MDTHSVLTFPDREVDYYRYIYIGIKKKSYRPGCSNLGSGSRRTPSDRRSGGHPESSLAIFGKTDLPRDQGPERVDERGCIQPTVEEKRGRVLGWEF